MMRRIFFAGILLVPLAFGCKCETSFSACNETGFSRLVFIGTVESIEPEFLSRWSGSNGASLQAFNAAFSEARENSSASSLSRLKSAFAHVVPNADAAQKSQLESATSAIDVMTLFNSVMSRGMLVRFKARTVFKDGDDDDTDDPTPKEATKVKKSARGQDPERQRSNRNEIKIVPSGEQAPEDASSFEVWTSFGECGYEFQLGETYLVYAGGEEGSAEFFVDKCSRTRRITDAGDDLAYLFFFKNQPNESARLEGFATTDRLVQLEFANMPEKIASPVAGIAIELRSKGLRRFARTDANGRFVFDGLAQGNYEVSAFKDEYRFESPRLSGPLSLQVEARGCARHLFLLPKSRK